MNKIKEGDIFKTKDGSTVVVVSYKNATDIIVEYQDETKYQTKVHSGNLRKGAVRNPYKPILCNVGYFGTGPYMSSNGKGGTNKCYLTWRSMIIRCYSPRYMEDHPSYKDCSVCEEWHNFQNFAEWYYKQPNACKKGFDLDKDLMIFGNKIYSYDTCSLVPQEINKLLCYKTRHRGELPQGVCRHGLKFKASINIEGKRVHIGIFDSAEGAYISYKREKMKYVRIMANKYKELLHPQVFKNLMGWELTCDPQDNQ